MVQTTFKNAKSQHLYSCIIEEKTGWVCLVNLPVLYILVQSAGYTLLFY